MIARERERADSAAAPPGDARLARAIAATHKRNAARPLVDVTALELSAIAPAERGALGFLIAQMEHIERTSTRNLGNVAAASPVPLVRAAYEAQIVDEIAHGRMLGAWLDRFCALGGPRFAPRILARAGVRAAAFAQTEPWLGVRHMVVLTEFYAAALLDELALRVAEPALAAVLAQIRQDEARHKVIVVEAVHALVAGGAHKRLLARTLGSTMSAASVAFFRRVFGGYLTAECAALALPAEQILERCLDEASDALACEV